MVFWRREQPQQPQEVLAEVPLVREGTPDNLASCGSLATGLCLPNSCEVQNDATQSEMSDDDANLERLEFLVQDGEEWGIAKLQFHGSVQALQAAFAEQNPSENRDARRNWKSNSNGALTACLLDNRTAGIKLLRSQLGAAWDEKMQNSQTPQDAQVYREQFERTTAVHGVVFEDKAENEFYRVFVAEQKARLGLVDIWVSAADLAEALFDPDHITSLPEPLQQLAALDIRRGAKGSIILAQYAQRAATGATGSFSSDALHGYVTENHLGERVSSLLSAMQIGASAAGAPTCPLNELGICKGLFDRVGQNLPTEVLRDYQKKFQTLNNTRTERLAAFAKNFSITNLVDITTNFAGRSEGQASVGSANRKQTVRVVSASQKPDLQEIIHPPEILPYNFTSVRAQVAGQEIVVSTDANKMAQSDEVLKRFVAENPMLKDFARTHSNTADFNAFLEAAVRAILLSPSYYGHQSAIQPVSGTEGKKYKNDKGYTETGYRLSGAKLAGSGGGDAARCTRIYFSQTTKGGVRYVTIHRLSQKGSVGKKSIAGFVR
jgi:hypothetical protein